ncbi:MAG: hypothetical protein EOP04_27925 [Proteobacteria bacterium]|nr:MAG: hypothetical protein EOP04_27925 [Pseudomonadota bacterium]
MVPESVYVSTLSKTFKFGDEVATGRIPIVDGEIGLAHTQIAILFDLNEFSVRYTLNRLKIPHRELDIKDCSALVEDKLISPALKKILFVSLDSVEELLLRIGTDDNIDFFDFIFKRDKVKRKFKRIIPFFSKKALTKRLIGLEREVASLRAKIQ